MRYQYIHSVPLVDLIIDDSYTVEAKIDSLKNNTASVYPTITNFTASKQYQNIILYIDQEMDDPLILQLTTTNLTKNITTAEQITIKCTNLNLCRPSLVTPTPAPSKSATPTPTPTITKTPTVTPTITLTPSSSPPSGPNTANYNLLADWGGKNGNVTTVGSNGRPSSYGTYDQTGNTWEWNDLDRSQGSLKGLRGGFWGIADNFGISSRAYIKYKADKSNDGIGFRVAAKSGINNTNFVTIADTGNPANKVNSKNYGSVDYVYKIAKYPVTNCEYLDFLNSVAQKDDQFGLWREEMSNQRCGIIRTVILPSPTPTETPTETPTLTPTESETPTPTPTESETPTPTPTESETPTPTPTETPTPTPTESETPTPTPTPTESETPTPTPTPTESETPTPTPTEETIIQQNILGRNNFNKLSTNTDDIKYVYSIDTRYANKPVVWVNWFDAARYCNWLHNNHNNPGSKETETGAYTLNGAVSGDTVALNSDANYWIPTENEWYKAAYYKGGANNGYWLYSTQSDNVPAPITANDNGDGSARTTDYICNFIPTPTPTESETPTPTPTESETPTPTPTESETPTPTPTETPTPTPPGPCGAFDTSIITVLGANPDAPSLWYGVLAGITLNNINSAMTLSFNAIQPAGTPTTVNFRINNVPLGSMNVGVNYIGRPFALIYEGIEYCSTFGTTAINN